MSVNLPHYVYCAAKLALYYANPGLLLQEVVTCDPNGVLIPSIVHIFCNPIKLLHIQYLIMMQL